MKSSKKKIVLTLNFVLLKIYSTSFDWTLFKTRL